MDNTFYMIRSWINGRESFWPTYVESREDAEMLACELKTHSIEGVKSEVKVYEVKEI